MPLLPIAETEDSRIAREFAELLDAIEYDNMSVREVIEDKPPEKCAVLTISERFMGMKAAIITNNASLKSFGGKLGITMLQWDGLIDNEHTLADLQLLASELLKLLGFQEEKMLNTSQFDLIFVHVGADEKVMYLKDIELINGLVSELMHIAQPGTDIGSRLHTSVIMSYGAALEDDNSKFSVSDANQKNNFGVPQLYPRQSYTMKGGKPQANVRHHCPMLVAQWQNAVTRKDMVKFFSFRDFNENGGILTIPADRFLHEVAFKLWKAPKYGA
ncbi:Hypothetical predicted protein [Olea europaea subsp. europaea]|uniref:Uncharacterized protein n=1 Tax=Olea europaea subsp. europaea TaxID=158383 RepID=A0A8S0RAQ9_OLEEU|nr:Hypothetical predicted protein [Olea europaea subsp. europaea]